VLSQIDTRYFRDIAGRASWTMDFTIVKEGEKEPIAESGHSELYLRNVHLEADLDEGSYIVYVRLDRNLDRNEVCTSLFIDEKIVSYYYDRDILQPTNGKSESSQGSSPSVPKVSL